MNAKLIAVVLMAAGFRVSEIAVIARVPVESLRLLRKKLTLSESRIVAITLTQNRDRWPSRDLVLRLVESLWLNADPQDREVAEDVFARIQCRLDRVGSEVLQ